MSASRSIGGRYYSQNDLIEVYADGIFSGHPLHKAVGVVLCNYQWLWPVMLEDGSTRFVPKCYVTPLVGSDTVMIVSCGRISHGRGPSSLVRTPDGRIGIAKRLFIADVLVNYADGTEATFNRICLRRADGTNGEIALETNGATIEVGPNYGHIPSTQRAPDYVGYYVSQSLSGGRGGYGW